MKRQIIIFVSLIFLTLAIALPANADTTGPSPTPVDYTLSYPGLLPDSPLYFLKALRDKLVAMFISNPVTASTFDIQESDKRIEAAFFLVTEEKKTLLAATTFSKGENYYSDALSKAMEAKTQGMNIAQVAPQLFLSNQKHLEMLDSIEQCAPADQRVLFVAEREKLLAFSRIVNKLQPSK
jgi:hypothetical protein